jgi:hypothetical protein
LEYSPRIPENFSGKIESRQNENMIELWVFDNNWKLLEWTRKDLSKNEIKSWQFDENWNLKEGYNISQNWTYIRIWKFNYDLKSW